MSKQSQLRQLRKLRRGVGAQRQERLALVIFDEEGATYVTYSGLTVHYQYSGNPTLDFATAEMLKYKLVERRFQSNDNERVFLAPSLTLKTLHRLFPKTKFNLIPNNP